MKFSSGQHRLEHIPGIHGSIRLSCAHNGVQFVNEQDDSAVTVLYFFQNCLQPFLKFAPVLGSSYQSAHIQGKYGLILQAFRHIPAHDTLRQAFHHRRLADARLADEHRVVLRLA